MPVKDTQRKNRHCLVTKLNNRVKNALFEVGDLEACQILGDLKKPLLVILDHLLTLL